MKRRAFVQNMSLGAGGFLLSPVLNQVMAQAEGNASPLRFVFVLEGNGRLPKYMQPGGIEWRGSRDKGVDRLIDQRLTSANKLPRGLAPLEPYKDRMTVIQGLSGKTVSVNGGGHSADFGALGCCPRGTGGKPLTQTIDAAVAKALPAVFPLLALGVSSRARLNMINNCSSWGRNKPIPTICDPQLAYSSIFGSVASGDARRRFSSDRNVLDFMLDDIKRVQPQLAGAEREKFEQHMAAFESLRDQQSRLNEIENTLRKHAPVLSDKYKSSLPADRLDAHFDLGAAALIAGLTNVLTIASGVGSMHFSVTFRDLGFNTAKHELAHGQKHESLDIIRAYHAELIVRLIRKLEAMPEGNGTMMDNTLIFFTSDGGDEHHAAFWQWPLLMIGDLGGRLKTRSRFLGYPKYGAKGHRTMANLYLSFLHAVGDRRKTFGIPDPNLNDLDQSGPLAELFG